MQQKIRQITAHSLGLDVEFGKVSAEIDKHRAKLGGAHTSRQNNDAIDKQVRVLENRLDKALVKFNKALAVNKRLRDLIDNLRRERQMFDNVYHKYEKELMEQKKHIAEIIENSNAAYEIRDEAQTKIIILREKAEKEYQTYIQEVKELDRTLEHDRKLKEFMATKMLHRAGEALNKGSNVKEKDMQKDGNNSEVASVSLEVYEDAFSKIRKVTGISDTSELVQRFKALEDKNFSLFNFVNEINNEIELISEEVTQCEASINKLKESGISVQEKHNSELQVLEKSLMQTQGKAETFDSQFKVAVSITNELNMAIQGFINSLQSIARQKPAEQEEQPNRAEKLRAFIDFALVDSLGENGVNENNLFQYLGMMEQKANELMSLNSLVSSPRKMTQLLEFGESVLMNSGATVLGQGPLPPVGNISIIAPAAM